jgi:hypothetical protein
VASSQIVSATQESANGANAPTQVPTTISCPAGKTLLGGGGRVRTGGTAAASDMALAESYPSASNTWKAVGTVIHDMDNGERMIVEAYAVCSA